MLFKVGIEEPETETEAYGVIVPVFSRLGYGCYSAADNEADIEHRATDAILSIAEDVVSDGHSLESFSDSAEADYSSRHPEYSRWITIELPIEMLCAGTN